MTRIHAREVLKTFDRGSVREALRGRAEALCTTGASLTCVPPGSASPHPYGDIVPGGILLRALGRYESPDLDASLQVHRFLSERRQGCLWSYHTGGLVTSLDSGLVLLGYPDPAGVEALEDFRDGSGYLPQRYSDMQGPRTMRVTDGNRHWCQPDYSIGLLVAGLRHEYGLSANLEVATIEEGFETRSGLYFANPYMVDWLLALALRGVERSELSGRLASEILASMNEDGSFGTYDPCLSSSLAVLALTALHAPASTLTQSCTWLMAAMDHDGWSGGTPFYSSMRIDESRLPARFLFQLALAGRIGQYIYVRGQVHAVSLYVDAAGLLGTAFASLALSTVNGATDPQHHEHDQSLHRRYQCEDPVQYVAEIALPPYLDRPA